MVASHARSWRPRRTAPHRARCRSGPRTDPGTQFPLHLRHQDDRPRARPTLRVVDWVRHHLLPGSTARHASVRSQRLTRSPAQRTGNHLRGPVATAVLRPHRLAIAGLRHVAHHDGHATRERGTELRLRSVSFRIGSLIRGAAPRSAERGCWSHPHGVLPGWVGQPGRSGDHFGPIALDGSFGSRARSPSAVATGSTNSPVAGAGGPGLRRTGERTRTLPSLRTRRRPFRSLPLVRSVGGSCRA